VNVADREREQTLAERLDERAAPATLFTSGSNNSVRCSACAHRCVIADGSHGTCGVRRNVGGRLFAPFGYVARRYIRAVETNTIYHVKPGSKALTFGMYGCDLRCPYCHNHKLSQALRDGRDEQIPIDLSAEQLVNEAVQSGCRVVCAAYNEPMITAEWASAIFVLAKERGLVTALVSDGNSTPEALAYMRPVTDVFRVDLKAHTEASYHALGGRLRPVLESIRCAKELGYWLEVVTLVVPGLNQEPSAIDTLARALIAIDRSIPWHLNAFVPRYRMRDRLPADAAFLVSAAGSAYARGMRFVYVGNVPRLDALSHTRCPRCHSRVVSRRDYSTLAVRIAGGACPECTEPLPGLW
jgi:pyruvate formate lyase activating enzyme